MKTTAKMKNTSGESEPSWNLVVGVSNKKLPYVLTRQNTKNDEKVLFTAFPVHDGEVDVTNKVLDLRPIGKDQSIYYLEQTLGRGRNTPKSLACHFEDDNDIREDEFNKVFMKHVEVVSGEESDSSKDEENEESPPSTKKDIKLERSNTEDSDLSIANTLGAEHQDLISKEESPSPDKVDLSSKNDINIKRPRTNFNQKLDPDSKKSTGEIEGAFLPAQFAVSEKEYNEVQGLKELQLAFTENLRRRKDKNFYRYPRELELTKQCLLVYITGF